MPFDIPDDLPGDGTAADQARPTRKHRIIAACVVVDLLILAIVLAVIFG